ncbi:phosphotransferase [Mycoplasma putrefaciens]|uniref:Choline/ethanolamine kinase family protein, LicA n=1 Tax=Mycoplasma putrefaciens (strain ATCC 15718 / NCTC 10155 / C30 KS-1 / KS-1) TaxID=743965 RepID=A0A7U4E9R2_MYCPK|nr:phosphotransferase [Mycoplasma putrefaciens]AEM68804.1 choline/ethanolamine kinase family protein, LicA [Mycoplasma putrefaciens KS1]
MRQKITKGGTNISYKVDDKFLQIKRHNSFNHKIDYSLLEIFDFVPKLLKNTATEIEWEFINGVEPIIDLTNIQIITKQIKQLHNSNLKFPEFNLTKRIEYYRTKIKELNTNTQVLDDYEHLIDQILKQMDHETPLHNDLFSFNMIQTKDNKIYFVDWEYATMGDKHFELAYLIETSQMSKECENKLLEVYQDYHKDKLLLSKIFVNYIVILWIRTQTPPPHDTKALENRIYQLVKEI